MERLLQVTYQLKLNPIGLAMALLFALFITFSLGWLIWNLIKNRAYERLDDKLNRLTEQLGADRIEKIESSGRYSEYVATGTCEGSRYYVELHHGGEDEAGFFKVYLDQPSSQRHGFDIEAKSEMMKLAIKMGSVIEYARTNNPQFDNEFYITASDPELMHGYFLDSEVTYAALELFRMGFDSVGYDGNLIFAGRFPDVVSKHPDLYNLVTSAVKQLKRMATKISAPQW
jgi:hypothetical protein